MADTFSHIYTVTGISGGLIKQCVTDGDDLYFIYSVSSDDIYKYDVNLNTHSLFVDGSSIFSAHTSVKQLNLQVFRGNLYAGFITSDAHPLPYCTIYRINSDGSATQVNNVFPRSVHNSPGGSGIDADYFELFATENFLVGAYLERRNFPGPPPQPAEYLSQHSPDGSSWTNSTNSFSDLVEINTTWVHGNTKDYRSLGIHATVPLGAQFVTLAWNAGVWTKVEGPSSRTLFETGFTYYWTADDLGEYTADWSVFQSPTSQQGSIVGLNMPWAVSQNVDATTIKRLDPDNLPIGLIIDSTMATDGFAIGSQTDHMIRANDGNVYLLMIASGATYPTWSIWKRSNPLTATPGAWKGSTSSGLHIANANFTTLQYESALVKVRSINQFSATPFQRNFQVSATDGSVYMGNQIGASTEQVARLQPPYTGTESTLDAAEDLTDSISSDDIHGVDLTDAI